MKLKDNLKNKYLLNKPIKIFNNLKDRYVKIIFYIIHVQRFKEQTKIISKQEGQNK